MTVTVRQVTNPAHMQWLVERAQLNLVPWLMAIEAVDENERILAMVGYERHYAHACMMHVALESPIHLKHVLRPGFDLAFSAFPNGLGCVEVFAPVRDDNRASLGLVEHLGFRKMHHGKDWLEPGVGIVWWSMRREECRFLGGR